jgi:hypothetical protein
MNLDKALENLLRKESIERIKNPPFCKWFYLIQTIIIQGSNTKVMLMIPPSIFIKLKIYLYTLIGHSPKHTPKID